MVSTRYLLARYRALLSIDHSPAERLEFVRVCISLTARGVFK